MKPARPKLGVREIGGRIALSIGVILASAISYWHHHRGSPPLKRTAGKISSEVRPPSSADVPKPVQPEIFRPAPEKEVAEATATPTTAKDDVAEVKPRPAPIPKPARKHIYFYKDGDYVGNPVDIFYGYVQVSVSIRDGWITGVKWLMVPEDIDLSKQINDDATPKLTKEAIKVQNAQVDMISGASFTVLGFRTSLGLALAQATLDHNTP